MNLETYFDKLEKIENIKYQVYLEIKTTPLSVPDITYKYKINRCTAQSIIRLLSEGGHVEFINGMNKVTGRKVKIYHFTGKDYVKRTRADFLEYVTHARSKMAVAIKKDKNFNPHATIYRLLDRPRQAPSPKVKGKNLYGGIQSSFSMMEFAS